MKSRAISARERFGKEWLQILQQHNCDRIEILRHSEKDGTLIPYDYQLTEVEYPGAANRFSRGEKIALLPGNSEYQPVISVKNNSFITTHCFKNADVIQILKSEQQKSIQISYKAEHQENNKVTTPQNITKKKSITVSIIQYAGIAAMLTGTLFIFTALK